MQKIINNTTEDILKRKTKESEETNMQELKSIKRENSKKEKAKLKAHSGITLIALVITIIVLLILAGVALATLTGDSGIYFPHAFFQILPLF